MHVLDVGCGTGAISKGIAEMIGSEGKVTGIDHTASFISHGQCLYQETTNLELIASDWETFFPDAQFDLIVSARVLQWLSTPRKALEKMKSWLKPDGEISILDYNHEALEWIPAPPKSMLRFYETFLKWRSDAGMNNRIAEDIPDLMQKIGLHEVISVPSDEVYQRHEPGFEKRLLIWSKVANSTQMVDEGYLDNSLRLLAIDEYNHWVKSEAQSMTMKLNDVRGKL